MRGFSLGLLLFLGISLGQNVFAQCAGCSSSGGGATIPSVTNIIKGNGSGNGADSGIAAANVGLVLTVSTLPTAALAVLHASYVWSGGSAVNSCPASGAGGSGGSVTVKCRTDDNSTWLAELMTDSAGNVGVGTSLPVVISNGSITVNSNVVPYNFATFISSFTTGTASSSTLLGGDGIWKTIAQTNYYINGGATGIGPVSFTPSSSTSFGVLDKTASTGATQVYIGYDGTSATSATSTNLSIVPGASQGSVDNLSFWNSAKTHRYGVVGDGYDLYFLQDGSQKASLDNVGDFNVSKTFSIGGDTYFNRGAAGLFAVGDAAFNGLPSAAHYRDIVVRSYESGGTAPGISGCSAGTQAGGGTIGSFASGTSGTCTVTLTFATTAPTGWFCRANDLTTTSDTVNQTATTTTTATLSGTTVSGDVINFGCFGY